MKKIFTKELQIGVTVLAALTILIFGIDYLKGINLFHPSNYYMVTYTDVQGLTVSAPVTLNGFKVGQVREIDYEYTNPGHITVELALNKELRVPMGSKAVITQDLLGTASVVLHLADHPDYHEVGHYLIGENQMGLMGDVTDELMPAISKIIPKVDTLLVNINSLVANPALSASITRIDQITANLDKATERIATAAAQLQPIATDVKHITGDFTGISSDLAAVASDVRAMPLDSLVADLQTTVANLRQLSDELNSKDSTVGRLLNDPSLYDNLNSGISSLDSLLIDIKRNPKRYISIKLL